MSSRLCRVAGSGWPPPWSYLEYWLALFGEDDEPDDVAGYPAFDRDSSRRHVAWWLEHRERQAARRLDLTEWPDEWHDFHARATDEIHEALTAGGSQ